MKQRMSAFLLACVLGGQAAAAVGAGPAAKGGADAPALLEMIGEADAGASELRAPIERFSADIAALRRSYPVRLSPARHDRLASFYKQWLTALDGIDYEHVSHAGQIDFILFRNYLQRQLRQLEIQKGYQSEAGPLMPFAQRIVDLAESRRHMQREDGAKAAATLTDLTKGISEVRKALEAGLKPGKQRLPAESAPSNGNNAPATAAAATSAPEPDPIRPKKTVANRAAKMVRELRSDLDDWYDFHNGYDPLFSWWVAEPYKQADKALDEYAKFLREQVVGVPENDNRTIIGDPIGREALLAELQFEMIPYTPEELIDIAQQEFRWCRAEMLKASNEMGFGDDWKAALEHVKQQHVEPGEQPTLVKELAEEAIAFVEEHDLVTVPDLCREVWRMTMMSPQQQLMSPFFLGGEVIQVAFPTSAMSHEAKLMTMRGNNRHFARATVHHELIPGHHLQGFMSARYRPYRELFDTPFWLEGWALYWEMLLYDMGFPQSPENRVGMLFWRTHRCVRIIFSLSFHLERMTPQECVDVLVEQVGHERANAEAEVRRSFEGEYGPLYQAAYMLGGLQIRALHKELVDTGKMTNREFHDAILRENSIPIEILRAVLMKENLPKDFTTRWRFADEQ